MTCALAVIRVVWFVVGPEAGRTFARFLGSSVNVVSVPIVVAAVGQGGGYGRSGDSCYGAIRAVAGVKDQIAAFNAVVDKISVFVCERGGIIASGMEASHFNSGEVLTCCGQGFSQDGPGLGMAGVRSPIANILFYLASRGTNWFQQLAALPDIGTLDAYIVVSRVIGAVHSHQTKTNIGKSINYVGHNISGDIPAGLPTGSRSVHGSRVVQDDENIWFAGLCGGKRWIGASIQGLCPCLLQAKSSKYQEEAQ